MTKVRVDVLINFVLINKKECNLGRYSCVGIDIAESSRIDNTIWWHTQPVDRLNEST